MTAFVLDAGALIALDRNERDVRALLRRAVAAGLAPVDDVAVVTSDLSDIGRLTAALLAPVRVIEV